MEKRFPLFIHMEKKKILVIGAGKVALRRIEVLLDFGADITVITKGVPEDLKERINALHRDGKIDLLEREFISADIQNEYFMVLAASDDNELNRKIVSLCKEKGILVNSASCREDCDFYFPAIVTKDTMVIGIAGDGSDHRAVAGLAAQVRKELQYERVGHKNQQGVGEWN